LADVQLAAGNEAGARASLKQVNSLDPTDVSTLLGLASLLQKAGDPAAQAVADRAVSLAPANAAAKSLLGSILVQQGQLEAGIRHLRDARLRDPNSGLVRYRLAHALAATGRLEEAKSEMTAALAATDKPTSAEAQKLRAQLGL
jgi:Flp pilus assembly protein TadD